MKKDVVIIGAGPAGIFTALEMLRKGSKKSILIVEKGKSVENNEENAENDGVNAEEAGTTSDNSE